MGRRIDQDLDYFFRFIDGKLTDEEEGELKGIDAKNKLKKQSDNPYAACGMAQDNLQLSMDTH